MTIKSTGITTESLPSYQNMEQLGVSKQDLSTDTHQMTTDKGRRKHLSKIVCLTILPSLILTSLMGYTVNDAIGQRNELMKNQVDLAFNINLGQCLQALQRECDMTVFYLSALGANTKSFLMIEYITTDLAITDLSQWTSVQDNDVFESKKTLLAHLSRHRQDLSRERSNVFGEIDFYTGLIDIMLAWWMDRLKRGEYVEVWTTVIGYAKIKIADLKLGIERALGTYFFAMGGFANQDIFEMYNRQVHTFNSFYYTAEMYMSDIQEMDKFRNVTERIKAFRYTIMYTEEESHHSADIKTAQYWFENVTICITSLRELQLHLETIIKVKMDNKLGSITTSIIISIVLMIFALLMCPVVAGMTEALSSSIHRYAVILVDKTNELSKEKRKTDYLLYQIVPRQVAEKLKKKLKIDAEYFKSATIVFSDIHNFASLVAGSSPIEIVDMINSLYTTIDDRLDSHDVYKVETINDCYMVASGLPKRNRKRHVTEIATLSLDLLMMIKSGTFVLSGERIIQLRFGINTGPCMAGVIGYVKPRYCLFGDTINTASRMMTHGEPNKIHLSPNAFAALSGCGGFLMEQRGEGIYIKGKGDMQTYWLLAKSDSINPMVIENVKQECGVHNRNKRRSTQQPVTSPNATSGIGCSDCRDVSSNTQTRKVSETEGMRFNFKTGSISPQYKRTVIKVSPHGEFR